MKNKYCARAQRVALIQHTKETRSCCWRVSVACVLDGFEQTNTAGSAAQLIIGPVRWIGKKEKWDTFSTCGWLFCSHWDWKKLCEACKGRRGECVYRLLEIQRKTLSGEWSEIWKKKKEINQGQKKNTKRQRCRKDIQKNRQGLKKGRREEEQRRSSAETKSLKQTKIKSLNC